jgi:DNA polymerase III delta prime subunit
MNYNDNEFLWCQKYRPLTIEECILPKNLKNTLQKFVDSGAVPNLLLNGTQGVGKTSAALSLLNEIGAESFVVNGSLDRNIETLRNDIQAFASTISFHGGRKYVIIDEADYLNPTSVQPALRNFIETYSKNTGFILTSNFVNKIIEPLHSRFSVINFDIPKDEIPSLASQFFKRICFILDNENIKYDKKVILKLIEIYFPDFRRTINELQRYSSNGVIDSGIFGNLTAMRYDELISFMKEKNFSSVRKWIGENAANDYTSLFEDFYKNCNVYFKVNSIPQLILILGKYQYQAAFAANQEINLAACMVEILADCEFN